MNNYTKSADIAGKLLEQMEEAGCDIPSATLFADGSGHFTVYPKDEVVVYEVLGLHLPGAQLYNRSSSNSNEVHFDFSTGKLQKYTSVCPT